MRLWNVHGVLRAALLVFVVSLLSGVVAQSASAAPPLYRPAVQIPGNSPFYAGTEQLWDPTQLAYQGKPGFPQTRQQALMLRLMVRAVRQNTPPALINTDRIADLVRTLTKSPSFVDGAYKWNPKDKNQDHIPGFTLNAVGKPGNQHIAIDSEIAVALAEAYQYADVTKLPEDLKKRIRYVVLRVAKGGLFKPKNVRIGQLLWTANMLRAKRLVDNDWKAFAKDYRIALDAERKLFQHLLTKAGGYRYGASSNVDPTKMMDTPVYSLISLAGIQFIQQGLRGGLKVRPIERQIYRRWLDRVIWGSFSNSGMLNWDEGFGDLRRYATQYWGWAALSLISLNQLEGTGLLSPASRARINGLCANIQQRYLEYQDSSGLLDKTQYGTASAFIDSKADRTVGPMRLLWAIESCYKAPPLTSAASFDGEQPRYAVTTSKYTTSIVSWSRDMTSGLLPTKILDDTGKAIGGLGGRPGSFDFASGALHLGEAYRAGSKVKLSGKSGSGPLSQRRTLRGTMTRGGVTAKLSYQFRENGFSINGSLKKAGGRVWRVPLGDPSNVKVTTGAKTVLEITPKAGKPWKVTIPEKAAVTLRNAKVTSIDPTSKKFATVRLAKGRQIRLIAAF